MNIRYSLLLCVLLMVGASRAADVYWTGGGTSHAWSVDANWLDSVAPTPLDTVVFDTNAVARHTNHVESSREIGGFVLRSGIPTNSSITVTGAVSGAILTNGASGIDLSGSTNSLTLLLNLDLQQPQTWTVPPGLAFSLHRLNAGFTLTGTGSVTLAGGGTFNFWPGPTGSTGFNDTNSFSTYTGNWLLGTGVTVVAQRNGRTAFGSGSIRMEGATLAQTNGNWTWTSPIEVVGGYTSTFANRSGGSGRFSKFQGELSGAGTLVLPNIAGAMTNPDTGFILTGSNSISGLVVIPTNGRVRVGGQPGDSFATTAGPAGTLGTAAVTNDGMLTFSRSDTETFANPLSGLGMVRIGGGVAGVATQVVLLRGDNTYEGLTQISGSSTLDIDLLADGSTSRIGRTGGLVNGVVFSTGVLRYSGSTPASTTRALALSNGTATIEVSDPAAVLTWNPVGGTRSNLLTKTGEGTFDFGGDLTSSGRLTVAGGRLQVQVAQSFTGPVRVTQGTLALSASASLASSQIDLASGSTLDVAAVTGWTLASGQTLSGAGLVSGAVQAAAGSVISPGLTTGTLTFAQSLTLAAGATNTFDLLDPNAAGDGTNDLLVVVGDFDPAGATLRIRTAAGAPTNGSYLVVSYLGNLLGTFNPVIDAPAGFTATLDTGTVGQIRVALAQSAFRKANNLVALNTTNSWVHLVVPGSSDIAIFDGLYAQTGSVGVGGSALTVRGIELQSPSSTVTIAGGSALNFANSTSSVLHLGAEGRLVFNPVSAGNWYGSFSGGENAELTMGGTANASLQFNYLGMTGTVRMRGVAVSNAFNYGGTSPAYTWFAANTLAPVTQDGAFALDLGTNGDERTLLLENAWTNATLRLRSLSGEGGIRADAGGEGIRSILLEQTNDTVFSGNLFAHASGGNALRSLRLTKRGGGTLLSRGLVGRQTLSAGSALPFLHVSVEAGRVQFGDAVAETLFNDVNTGSVWRVDAGATLGFYNSSVITSRQVIAGDGVLYKDGAGDLRLAGGNSFSGTVRIAGGTVAYLSPIAAGSLAALEIDSGRVALTEAFNTPADAAVFRSLSSTNPAAQIDPNYNGVFTAGTRTLEIRQDTDTVFAGILSTGTTSRDIRFVKQGAGTLVLHGLNTYGGETVISGGVLRVNGALGTGAVTLDPASVLGGTGVLYGATTQAGTLEPGYPIGRLSVSNDLTVVGSAVTRFELAGTNEFSEYDQLMVGGWHYLEGSVDVVLTNAYTPQAGDRFVLIQNPLSQLVDGGATLNLPALTGGTGWAVTLNGDTLTLVVTGALYSPTPYEQWADAIPDPAQRGDQEDPDGDGFANLFEYSQGTDPTNAADGLKLAVSVTNATQVLKFQRATGAVDLVYLVQSATGAQNAAIWQVVASNGLGGGWVGTVVETNSGPVVQVFATDSLPGATQRVMRLYIERP